MIIHLAADHAGFELKEKIKPFLAELGHEVKDRGALKYDEKDDYPDFISKAAEAVSKNPKEKAIIFGGSGQGEAMVANRYKNVRATAYYSHNKDIIKLSRGHNDANILSIGARFISEQQAKEAIKQWLSVPFTEEPRHKRRIAKF
jgi:ribose 5-phosphate isomerase B